MIITTSGSNAGIGFAVPIDTVRAATNGIISTHRVENNVRPAPGLLGIGLCSTRMKETLFMAAGKNIEFPGVLISSVKVGSAADLIGMKGLDLNGDQVTIGDRIVAIGGSYVNELDEITEDFQRRVAGEVVNLTLEDMDGKRRIVETRLA